MCGAMFRYLAGKRSCHRFRGSLTCESASSKVTSAIGDSSFPAGWFRSAAVKPPRVSAQDRRLVLFLQIVALQDFIDLFHTIADRDLVRKIGGEHERLGPDALDRVGQRFLVAFA